MDAHHATLWEALADELGDAVALVQGSVRRSWAELDDRAARLAGALAAAGLRPGDKVAQFLFNSPAYIESWFGILKGRGVPVNVNYRYVDDELAYLLENADARAIVFHASLADRVARVVGRIGPLDLMVEVDDTALAPSARLGTVPGAIAEADLLAAHDPAPRIRREPTDITMTYTGGTTGMPKGVMSTIGPGARGLLVSVPPMLGMAPLSDLDEIPPLARRLVDDGQQFAALPACPLMHATGLAIGAIPALAFGGRVVLLERRGLDPDELWDTVEREQVNGITVVGDAFARPMLAALDARPGDRDVSSVRLLLSAGAMFSAEVKDGLLTHLPGAAIVDYIAATEGMMGVSISVAGRPAATASFRPAPGVVVLDEDDRVVEAGSGRQGILAVPNAATAGYYKDDDKTARTFRVVDGVRYSFPGDWATVEADGTIRLLGRGSQCINTGGEKVYPEEVEEAIKRHPRVADCLVFGLPDERFGQRVVAVASIDGTDAPDPSEVIESAGASLSAYKLPRSLVFVDSVPRAPNGKADYPGARALFEALAATPTVPGRSGRAG